MRLFLLLLALVLAGCHRAARAPVDAAPADPAAKLYDQVRQGSFLLTTVVTDLDDVRKGLKELKAKVPAKSELRESLDGVDDDVDGCGADIADFTTEPPEFDAFKKQIPAYTDYLARALSGAGDALRTLDGAWGDVDSMRESPPKGLEDQLDDLDGAMETAYDDLASAIRAMGGTPPDPGESDDAN